MVCNEIGSEHFGSISTVLYVMCKSGVNNNDDSSKGFVGFKGNDRFPRFGKMAHLEWDVGDVG